MAKKDLSACDGGGGGGGASLSLKDNDNAPSEPDPYHHGPLVAFSLQKVAFFLACIPEHQSSWIFIYLIIL